MPSFLIDAHTVSSFWVTEDTEEEAIHTLYKTGRFMDRIFVDGGVELVNFNVIGGPQIVCDDTEFTKDEEWAGFGVARRSWRDKGISGDSQYGVAHSVERLPKTRNPN